MNSIYEKHKQRKNPAIVLKTVLQYSKGMGFKKNKFEKEYQNVFIIKISF
jgi:hypothetical protein